ncbi:MAG: hypothetical protein ACK521_12830 [bacterium]|jgi:hypothetical protein
MLENSRILDQAPNIKFEKEGPKNERKKQTFTGRKFEGQQCLADE